MSVRKYEVDSELTGVYQHKFLGYVVFFLNNQEGVLLTDVSHAENKVLARREVGVCYRWSWLDSEQWEKLNLSYLTQ